MKIEYKFNIWLQDRDQNNSNRDQAIQRNENKLII